MQFAVGIGSNGKVVRQTRAVLCMLDAHYAH